MTVNILGTDYAVKIKKWQEDETFERLCIDGYCNEETKEIVICDLHTCKEYAHQTEAAIVSRQNHICRHELIHVFLNESGLCSSSMNFPSSWAINEEMVDWIAIQIPKMVKAMQECGAL